MGERIRSTDAQAPEPGTIAGEPEKTFIYVHSTPGHGIGDGLRNPNISQRSRFGRIGDGLADVNNGQQPQPRCDGLCTC